MHININWFQLTSGWSTQVFQDQQPILYIPNHWLTNLQEFMQICNITASSPKFWCPKISRSNDKLLMDEAGRYTSNIKHLKWINNWRLYFQALTLSDICDGYGKQIQSKYRNFKDVTTNTTTRTSKLLWPKQAKPNATSFAIWKQFLVAAFGMQGAGGEINNKLEEWIEDSTESTQKWKFYYCTHTHTLYKFQQYYYQTFTRTRQYRLYSEFDHENPGIAVHLPATAIPATLIRKKKHYSRYHTIRQVKRTTLSIKPMHQHQTIVRTFLKNYLHGAQCGSKIYVVIGRVCLEKIYRS